MVAMQHFTMATVQGDAIEGPSLCIDQKPGVVGFPQDKVRVKMNEAFELMSAGPLNIVCHAPAVSRPAIKGATMHGPSVKVTISVMGAPEPELCRQIRQHVD